jgi:hypothetical protein
MPQGPLYGAILRVYGADDLAQYLWMQYQDMSYVIYYLKPLELSAVQIVSAEGVR